MRNTPDTPAKKPDDRMIRGGNYWTLFTPGIWKVLHAVCHACHVKGDTIGNNMHIQSGLRHVDPDKPLHLIPTLQNRARHAAQATVRAGGNDGRVPKLSPGLDNPGRVRDPVRDRTGAYSRSGGLGVTTEGGDEAFTTGSSPPPLLVAGQRRERLQPPAIPAPLSGGGCEHLLARLPHARGAHHAGIAFGGQARIVPR